MKMPFSGWNALPPVLLIVSSFVSATDFTIYPPVGEQKVFWGLSTWVFMLAGAIIPYNMRPKRKGTRDNWARVSIILACLSVVVWLFFTTQYVVSVHAVDGPTNFVIRGNRSDNLHFTTDCPHSTDLEIIRCVGFLDEDLERVYTKPSLLAHRFFIWFPFTLCFIFMEMFISIFVAEDEHKRKKLTPPIHHV